MTAPPAQGVRVAWEAVPEPVRAGIEQICGTPVVRARTQPGGFSPGVAARVLCADGTRWFLLADLEQGWAAPASGNTLVHADIRADNLLLAGDQVMIVDWPHACLGAPFIDAAIFAPSVAMQGGPAPSEVVGRTRAGREADPDALLTVVCGLAGYLTERSLRPAAPGLPTVRAFQAAGAQIVRDWLAELLRAQA